MSRITLLAVVLGQLALAAPAQAGRRPWTYAEDNTMVPDGDVEIETWVGFIERKEGTPGAWHWWLGVYWSPIESLEVAALTAITQAYEAPDGQPRGAELWVEQLSIRWRIIERKFGALFLKLEGRIAFADNVPFQLQPSLAWAKHAGRFGFAASFGYAGGFEGGGATKSYHWLVYRAAISLDIVKGDVAPPFQLGVELYSQEQLAGQNDLTNNTRSSVMVGPTIAAAKGRLWLNVGALAGVTGGGPTVLIRGIIGLSL